MQINFAKSLIEVNRSADNLAVLAELEMYLVAIPALKSSIEYWFHVIKSEGSLYMMQACLIQNSMMATKINLLLKKIELQPCMG